MEKKHPLCNCEKCPLYETGTFFTQPTTTETPKFVVFSGEPTKQEIYGSGFRNTSAGKLMRSVLNFHRIKESDVQYANAIRCSSTVELSAAQTNKAAVCCSGQARNTAKTGKVSDYEVQGSAGNRPEAVVTLGASALRSVVGLTSVTRSRVGSAKRHYHIPVPVVSTVHPSSCMFRESNFPFLVTDIGKLVNKADKFVEPEYDVIKDASKAYDYLMECKKLGCDTLVIDIETATEKDLSVSNPAEFEMLCIGVKYGNHRVTVLAKEALNSESYRALKELANICYVTAHNGKFDLNGLRQHVGKLTLNFDTMLASYVFDERSGVHSLKYLAQEYLNAPDWEKEVEKYIGTSKNFANVPADILHKYNAFDVHCTWLLRNMYDKRFEDDLELYKAFKLLIGASNMLMDVEYNGMFIDLDYAVQLDKQLRDDIAADRNRLRYLALKIKKEGFDKSFTVGYNPNSWKQTKAFYAACGIGVDSTDAATLTKILEYEETLPNDELVREFTSTLLEYRKQQKLHSTYVVGISDRVYNGFVHPSFMLHGTVTGRLSCKNPNLQNIPRQSPIKGMFVARHPDWVIVNADYSQAELRTMSYLAKDKYFRDIFDDPTRDVFDELVPRLFPGSSKEETPKEVWKEQRTMVKSYVYGLNYGRTEHGIAKAFGITKEDALEKMHLFFSTIPEIIKWQSSIKQAVLEGEDLVTPYARRRRYSLITKENQMNVLNEALAFVPQSTASDMTLSAAINLNNMFSAMKDTLGYSPKIVNLVHDSIMAECHKDDAEEIARIMREEMISSAEKIVGDYVKFAADSSYAYSWKDIS